VKRDGRVERRRIRHHGDKVATLFAVVGDALVMIFEDDAMGRLRSVWSRDVRNAQPREQEAEGYQEDYQDLRAETFCVEADHRLSERWRRSLVT
jgi:hypothetical protein